MRLSVALRRTVTQRRPIRLRQRLVELRCVVFGHANPGICARCGRRAAG